MFKRLYSILEWLLHLFNPPPIDSMDRMQKIGRTFLITFVLVVNCILISMLGALAIFIAQTGHRFIHDKHDFIYAMGMIWAGITVNAICIVVLFQVKKFDRRLMEKKDDADALPVDLK